MRSTTVRSKQKTERAKARRGLFPAGLSYGYRIVRDAVGEEGHPIKGQRAIDEAQAKVVRRIYSQYAGGMSARVIAQQINNIGMASPRGGQWRVGTIYGILRNDIYHGRLIYNRTTLAANGKRTFVLTPRSEWIETERTDLRIVSDQLWFSVQQHQQRQRQATQPEVRKDHFAHLVRCGVCGSHCVMADRRRLTCEAAKHHNKCHNYRQLSSRLRD